MTTQSAHEPLRPDDAATLEAQLGRPVRGAVAIAWRAPNGDPGVVVTLPRLPGGTPFPTVYYLTHPVAVARVSTLEANHVMAQMNQRLATDAELAAGYRAAHEQYLADRAQVARAHGLEVPEIEGISAGGMPNRVKCLHVLAGHALAAGPGVNPLGDEVLAAIGDFWSAEGQPGAQWQYQAAPDAATARNEV